VPTNWDAVAYWYDGWVGEAGSEYHREVAVPVLIDLLAPQSGEHILDVGAGQGVLAPYIARSGARYTGVDASPRLIKLARQRHGKQGSFLVGDARNLSALSELHEGEFDGITFLLSIQDMDPLDAVLRSAAWALKPGGRVVLLLTHPAFRIPRQSGWGWDEGRKLHFRRVDSYLTPLAVPMKSLSGKAKAATRSFHRPLGAYVNALADAGLLVEQMDEIPAHKIAAPQSSVQAAHRARQEIPLFLGLRARKVWGLVVSCQAVTDNEQLTTSVPAARLSR
jgi:ubiquinone/menaquinone biosynthesis C-methylase UbiE